ncbi:MAG: TIGR03619 family F420-dependent LLM class oxidoreductase [Chloroflexi bacterium]|nr:TIGR03619 family F420-dependent LLM class oxidoreductase [Chloroflexota bacterium]
MQVGVQLPQLGERASRDLVIRHALAAEEAGFDALWVNDHVMFPREWRSPYPYAPDGEVPPRTYVDHSIIEPLAELTFVAGVTSTIGLGTSVLVLNYRSAAYTAKLIASIDHLAGGRFVLGAGMGWAREEMEVLGQPTNRRGDRFEANVRVIRALLDEEWVDGLETEFHTVDGWTARPLPPRHVPIWIGGDSEQQMRRIGELGDGWLAHAGYISRAEEAMAPAREAAERAGRDPAALRIGMNNDGILAEGRLEQAAERLHTARDSGVNHAIIGLHPRQIEDAPDLAQRFASDYLAELQAE